MQRARERARAMAQSRTCIIFPSPSIPCPSPSSPSPPAIIACMASRILSPSMEPRPAFCMRFARFASASAPPRSAAAAPGRSKARTHGASAASVAQSTRHVRRRAAMTWQFLSPSCPSSASSESVLSPRPAAAAARLVSTISNLNRQRPYKYDGISTASRSAPWRRQSSSRRQMWLPRGDRWPARRGSST